MAPNATNAMERRSSRGADNSPLDSKPPPERKVSNAKSRNKPKIETRKSHSEEDQEDDDSINSSTFPPSEDIQGPHGSLGSMALDGSIPPSLLGSLNEPKISDNTPAAEALRANAEVRVRKVGKLARSLQVQSLRKLVKAATFRAKSGNVRGKPPRVPPSFNAVAAGGPTKKPSTMYVLPEEDEGMFKDDVESSLGSDGGSVVTKELRDDGPLSAAEFIIENEELKAMAKNNSGEAARSGKEVKISKTEDHQEILQTQKWKRGKKPKRKESRKSYVKGKVIDGQHELYALSIAVILGVRTSIGTTNAVMNGSKKRWLDTSDFKAMQKYEFRPSGGLNRATGVVTPPHQLGHTFKFKDYSPVVFAYLRRMFGINEFDFLLSVCGDANFIEFISNAKSGQFFFYSRDGKFMIKTMTNAESKFLRRILPSYFKHCSQNPNTMLTKFLGMYRVKLYHLRRNVKFVIMNSVYYTDKYLQSFYDLKGSVTGRDAKPHHDVKKDNDLRRAMPDGALCIYPATRTHVREQIKADVEFMRRMNIMDYSMLVGVHHIPPKQGLPSQQSIGKSGFRFTTGGREGSLRLRDLVSTQRPSQQKSSTPSKLGTMSTDDSFGAEGGPSTPAAESEMGFSREDASHLGTITSRESGGSSRLLFGEFEDDDDNNSYLEGSKQYYKTRVGSNPNPYESIDDSKLEVLEMKKEQTIEKLFWPYHRYWDIHGHRRMQACRTLSPETVEDPLELFDIPPFVKPLSDRKDGGFEMDVTGFNIPMYFKAANGTNHPYEGKIFYMGIIDILQKYNMRKRLEARYRRLQGSGWRDASCVHPRLYAERFLEFFDEYSQRNPGMTLEDGEEEVVFQKEAVGSNKNKRGGPRQSAKASKKSSHTKKQAPHNEVIDDDDDDQEHEA